MDPLRFDRNREGGGGAGDTMERTAVVDLQRQSDGRSEIITLITLVLWTEQASRDGKSKAGQAEPPYRCNIIDIDRSQCIFVLYLS